ncbi:IS200/IS605 family transposase [Epilithonimonas ginsengisoli]|uniref:IS200/IS605 family transposase n=1 Tax=Epilithonimonas ginsengisoli TaxID=1245592 RepID=A0ABU4JE28_9FLAO|nr:MULTISPECIES: IS200/IS605 family transposase [Chryseobacterium group]MBV6879381.1 IS200/IS605 family transposase [Epilithonimonas sp. FP105]MDW8547920.1 IS200/IS605 family transposase [Epilithonimonas ginsengisoli]OAH73153.1 transposase [Chryseobacterium sp. FP211-J200]
MSNTYVKLYVQAVFAVKYRNSLIKESFRKKLFAVIGNLINETGCKTIIVNGVEDHVHCFFTLKSTLSLSDVMKSVKAKSSKWINENGFLEERFEWQRGFGGFSYNQSSVDKVYKYIENQKEHHKNQTFKEEYLQLLKKFEVDYDENYLFEDLTQD